MWQTEVTRAVVRETVSDVVMVIEKETELVQHVNFVKEKDINSVTFKATRQRSTPRKTLPLRPYPMGKENKVIKK